MVPRIHRTTSALILLIGWLVFAGSSPRLAAQSDRHVVMPRAQFSPSETAAFSRALQVFDPDGKFPAEDMKLYGHLRLGMDEGEFKAKYPAARAYFDEPKFLFTSYVQGKGFRYSFWSGHLYELVGIISTFATGEDGLAAAQKRAQEYCARARKLFGDPNKELSDATTDRDYQTAVWILSRDDQGDALSLSVSSPKRLSKTTLTKGIAASVRIFDDDTEMALMEVARKAHYQADPETMKTLQRY